MIINKVFLGLALALPTLTTPVSGTSEAPVQKTPRSLVHLLDYLGSDYAGAVSASGQILSESEFKEQMELASFASEVAESLSSEDGTLYSPIVSQVKKLEQLIHLKSPPLKIAKASAEIKAQILKVSHLSVAPGVWPSQWNGKKVFETNCVSCHGAAGFGDGPAGVNLNPRPFNFHDSKMGEFSPFHIFNVVRLGIPLTAMPAFTAISEKDTWDLAFYVMSIRHRDSQAHFIKWETMPTLDEVATLSDEALESKVGGSEEERKSRLVMLRLTSNDQAGPGDSLRFARDRLNDSVTAYGKGNVAEARGLAVSAYLEGVEPVEPQIKAQDAQFLSKLEIQMALVREDIQKSLSLEKLQRDVELAKQDLTHAESLVSARGSSFWMSFSLAAGIVIREGFEAVLIILAVLGVIRATKAKRAAHFVHAGWMSSIVIGVVCWIFSGWVLQVSGAQRELSEAIGSLFAVVVLLYMGFWLHSKTEIKRWTAFIDGKVRKALDGGSSRWGLFALAFIAAFREALETVLFLRALLIQGTANASTAVLMGVIFSLLFVILLAWLLLRFSVRIPIRQLFGISSWLMVVLSVILIGKGLHSLQETGFLSTTFVSVPLHSDFFGLYPNLETTLGQIGVLSICFLVWWKTKLRAASAI